MRAELAPWRRGPLTDPATVAAAAGVAVGAWWAPAVPVVPAAALALGALATRRAIAIVVAGTLLAGGLGHRALEGLSAPEAGPFAGTATLVTDPDASFGGWRADVRTSLGRLELRARGGAGGRLSSRRAGEKVTVVGRVAALADTRWAVPRHVRGRLDATSVEALDGGGPLARLANGVRSLVVGGARSLPDDQRALFTGFVLGDDRGASIVVADDFQGAGLTHLLVVSGQNVVFVLAVAAPLVGRLGGRGRVAATLALLLVFATVTRFEPSVLRATAMAGVGAVGVALGRPLGAVRVLSLAVVGLVLVDPLLVRSIGFLLSVAASAGIVVLARPLASALPGPAALRAGLGVTLAAQAAVAPLLVPTFGPMPLAAVPANLLAEPVAGALMMWGCTAGLLGGALPGPLAAALHVPTRVGLWWVASVARIGARAPLGHLGLVAVALAALALGAVVWSRRRRGGRAARAVAATVLVALVIGAVLGARRPLGPGAHDVGGAVLWRGSGPGAGTVLVVPGDARTAAVLEGLRTRNVRHLDLVVVRSPGPTAAETVRTVAARVEVATVWVPPGARTPGTVPASGTTVAGGLAVTIQRTSDGLAAQVTPARGARGAVG